MLTEADSVYERFHVVYSEKGFWKNLRDGVKQLHLVDVEIGRILLRREGYTGSLDELRRVVGKFDEKVRASCRSSGTTREQCLPPPLHMPQECSKTGQEADKAAG